MAVVGSQVVQLVKFGLKKINGHVTDTKLGRLLSVNKRPNMRLPFWALF